MCYGLCLYKEVLVSLSIWLHTLSSYVRVNRVKYPHFLQVDLSVHLFFGTLLHTLSSLSVVS